MMMRTLRTLALFVCTLAFLNTSAQQFSITSGSGVSCGGVIEDSGGPSGPYSDNENFTFTICPDVPGNVIYLTWTVFNLSTAGNNDDNIAIYDGDNTSATPLGSYTGTSLQNLVVSGTVFNATGCLTLVFQSNNTGTGEFAASFQCTVPCLNPTAMATMSEGIPAMVCQNEVVTFDGSGSSAQEDYEIVQYLWDFDDGTVDSTSGPITSHSFAEAGEYVVQLYVTDNNDCRNLNLVDLEILVSTTPDFSQTDPSIETCFGETVSLFGNAQPVTWTGIPDANFGDGVFLPDDIGLPFTSVLTFEQFNSGQLVTSTSNILSVCVEMEHTFMGDLVLQVICPNGQTTILHQQGGGGTYIGSPNDTDSNLNPVIGECWEYCWSPTATNGTWVEAVAAGGNTTPSGIPQNGSINPGTYEAVQSFDNLIGCPLNGDWTYQSTDLWGADNGFICSWSMNFDPSIIPDVTTYTPTFGPDADSTLWTGGTVPDAISANGDTITFTATAPGVYPFNYQVTDNFGCTYDTTITVTIQDPFLVDAGADVVICSEAEQLAATIVGATTSCAWVLQMNDAAFDGWNGANLNVNIAGASNNYNVPFGGQTIVNLPVQSGDAITLNYSPGFWEGEVSYTLFDDQGNIVFQDGPNPTTGVVWTGNATCNASQGMVWSWTPEEGLSDPAISNPTVLVSSPTTYVVTAHVVDHPVCFATDTLMVTLDPGLDPGLDSLVVVCATPPSFQLIDMLAGTPNDGGVWTDAVGNVVPDTFDPVVDLAGIYTYTVTTPLGCVGTADLEIEILPASDPSCCGVVDAGPDSTVCTLTYLLSASVGNTGVGNWSGPAGYTFGDAFAAETTVSAPGSGAAMFYWIEDDGVLCYLVDSVTITFTEPLVATVTTTDAICFEACDGTASVAMTGGNGAYTYTWSDALAGDTLAALDICAGDYSITVVDTNACTTTTEFTIGQPILLEIDATSFVEPWCYGGCDGSITITDAEAVEYSFNGGGSWTTSPTLTDACSQGYDLMIRNADGCEGTLPFLLPQPPEVIAEFAHGPIPANVNAPTIYFRDQSQQAVTWEWDIANLLFTTDQNPAYTFSNKEPGIYDVCLIARDAHQCPDTICHTVIIDDVLFTYVPNAFTPDGDGVNEVWAMSSNIPDIKTFEVRVFDRWGEVVYESIDPYTAWDGTYRNGGGELLKQDVYVYKIVYQIASTGGVREHIGHVSLLK